MGAGFETRLLSFDVYKKRRGVVCGFLGVLVFGFREGVLWLIFPLVIYNVIWQVFDVLFESSAKTMTSRA